MVLQCAGSWGKQHWALECRAIQLLGYGTLHVQMRL